MEITREIATRVRDTVRQGLVSGLGNQVPGQMCIEAAVCFALGLPHGDNPPCVSRVIRTLKIRLNDSCWSSNETRASGMLRLSLLQLGTDVGFDNIEFARRLVPLAREMANAADAAAADAAADATAAYAAAADAAAADAAAADAADAAAADAAADAAAAADAYAADAAADAAAADALLLRFAKGVENILISMGVPGVQWLPLLDE